MTTAALNRFGKYPRKWVEADTVLFKYQGSPEARADTSRLVDRAIRKYGGQNYEHIARRDEVDLVWSDQKTALFGILQMHTGSMGYITDVWCVFTPSYSFHVMLTA